MKKSLCLTLTLLAISVAFLSVPVSALSEAQSGAVVQNCASIKQSLRALERTDARTRSYLGSAYEAVLTNFIAPLNLRLINTGQPNTNLTTLHSEIIETRKNFISEYTAYSQSLEDLVSSDCYSHPEDFYNKLYETRKKRAALSSTTTTFRNLLSEHLTAVRKLKTSLGAKDGTDQK